MNQTVIVNAKNIKKTFRYQKKSAGIKTWFKPEYVEVEAVKNISLTIEKGEMVAFIGPNGAGKSTTIKMLSGILSPTSGHIQVCGLNPIHERAKLSYKIGCVFGQRSQLLPNLPLRDSFELFGKMYDLTNEQINARIAELSETFNLHKIIDQPTRQLSLGQRMRGEIVACIIHRPEIVFLDEPTIGLDIESKLSLRKILKNLNEKEGTTVFLTSHDTGDIEAIAQRTVVIDKGTIIVDEETKKLRSQFVTKKYFKVFYEKKPDETLIPGMNMTFRENTIKASVDTKQYNVNDALANLSKLGYIKDIQVYDEKLDDVILAIYSGAKKHETNK